MGMFLITRLGLGRTLIKYSTAIYLKEFLSSRPTGMLFDPHLLQQDAGLQQQQLTTTAY